MKIIHIIAEHIYDTYQRHQLNKTRRWLQRRALNFYVATYISRHLV